MLLYVLAELPAADLSASAPNLPAEFTTPFSLLSAEVLDRSRVRSGVEAAIDSGQRFSIQYRILTAAGSCKWVVEQGEMVIEGFIEDISEQRGLLEAMEQAELRYRHIFEHASEGIFQTTSDGHYLAANPALARIYGAELIADLSDIEHRLYIDPGRRDSFHRLMRTRGEVLNFESEVCRRDGSRIWISENAHIVRGPESSYAKVDTPSLCVRPFKFNRRLVAE